MSGMSTTVGDVVEALRAREIHPARDVDTDAWKAHCPSCSSDLFPNEAASLTIAPNGVGPELTCVNGCPQDAILIELGLAPTPRPVAGIRDDRQLKRIGCLPKHNETDLGNARRLVLDHRGDLLHVAGLGWLESDDTRYVLDVDGRAMRRAKESVRRIIDEASAMFALADTLVDDEAKRAREAAGSRLQHAKRSQNQPRLEAMLKCASTEKALVVSINELDRDPFLFNTPDGTVELRTGTLREHRREDRLTKIAGAGCDPSLPTPRWVDYLATTFGGDDELIAYVQRAVGYSLTASMREQAMFLAAGDGLNGKTTGLGIIAEALGDYAMTVDPVTFTTAASDRSARSDIARLVSARMVWGSEISAGAQLDLPRVKQWSGGDPIVARFLYREEFEFSPAGKIWLTVNNLPRIGDTGHAIWRRLRVIPFDVRIKHPDKHLAPKLRAELPGIIAWAVQGCIDWQRQGLGTCDAVERATAAYRHREDRLGQFLAECCHLDPEARISNPALKDAYHVWERARGGAPMTDLSDRLDKCGFATYRTKSERGRTGLRLTTAADRVTEGDE